MCAPPAARQGFQADLTGPRQRLLVFEAQQVTLPPFSSCACSKRVLTCSETTPNVNTPTQARPPSNLHRPGASTAGI